MASKTIDYLINIKGNAESKAKSLGVSIGSLTNAAGIASTVVAGMATAAVAAGTAFVGLRSDIANLVDETNTLAKSTGLANETIAGLRLAAKSTGKNLEQLVPTKLAKNMSSAAMGAKDMQRVFDALGVSVQTPTGELRDTDSVFRDVIDSLTGMENKTEAAALAMQVLGRNGGQLLSAFENSGSLDRFVDISEKYGIRVGPDAVAATGAWQQATANLSLAMDDLKQSVFDVFGSDFLNARMRGFAEQMIFVSRIIRLSTKEIAADLAALQAVMSGDLGILDALKSRSLAGSVGRIFSGAYEDAVAFGRDAFGGGDQFVGPTQGFAGAGVGGASGAGGKPVEITWPAAEIDGLPTRSAQEIIADRLREIRMADEKAAAAQIEALQSLEPHIEGAMGRLVGALPVVGSLLKGLGEVITNAPAMVNSLRRDLVNGPLKIGKSFQHVMDRAIPKLIESLPLIVENLVLKMPAAIARGIILGIPKILMAFARMIADQIKKLFSFLKGGEDRNILTGKRGKWLGTSFRRDNFSIFGLGNRKSDKIEGFASGGFVSRTGMALVHAGERIIPTSGADTGATRARRSLMGGGMSIGTVNVTVKADNPHDFIRQLRRHLGTLGSGATLTPFS